MIQGNKVVMGMAWSLFVCILPGCEIGSAKADPSTNSPSLKTVPVLPTDIAYVRAKRQPLPQKTYVNGKIAAFDRVEVKFETNGRIVESALKNGQYVSKDDHLARIDDSDLQFELANEYIDLEKAQNERQERMMLVSGGDFGDSSVTDQQLKYIDIVSGYNRAKQAIRETEYQLSKTLLLAPFNGLVANLKIKNNQYVNIGEALCTLINPSSFEAQFEVTESQAVKLKKGQTVFINQLSEPDHVVRAKINAVNPLVDENGLVKIFARVLGEHSSFFEGMNIRVAIEEKTPPVVVIPKDALVLRSGRSVVFTYDPESERAKWNYVKAPYENDNFIGIAEGLSTDDLVIVKGNLNLDHDSRVSVIPKQ